MIDKSTAAQPAGAASDHQGINMSMDYDNHGEAIRHGLLMGLLQGGQAGEAQPAVQQGETLVRYCPGCGSVGPVEAKYRDCYPDGNEARLIPQALAEKCRDTFKIALGDLIAAQGQEAEPVAVVGEQFALLWIGSGPIAPLVERNGIKVGTKLYAGHPPRAQADAKVPVAQGDAEDAARYRAFINCGQPICFMGEEYFGKDALDAAIDAARSQAKEGA